MSNASERPGEDGQVERFPPGRERLGGRLGEVHPARQPHSAQRGPGGRNACAVRVDRQHRPSLTGVLPSEPAVPTTNLEHPGVVDWGDCQQVIEFPAFWIAFGVYWFDRAELGLQLDRPHSIVAGIVLNLRQAMPFHHRGYVVPEAAAQAFLQPVPAAHRILLSGRNPQAGHLIDPMRLTDCWISFFRVGK